MDVGSQPPSLDTLLRQYQALLEINNAVVSQLDLRDLLKIISPCLRQVIPHDAALLTLHDPESGQLRLQALDLQMFGKVPFEEGVLISMDDTPEGLAITSHLARPPARRSERREFTGRRFH
jgi:hypothetical protein